MATDLDLDDLVQETLAENSTTQNPALEDLDQLIEETLADTDENYGEENEALADGDLDDLAAEIIAEEQERLEAANAVPEIEINAEDLGGAESADNESGIVDERVEAEKDSPEPMREDADKEEESQNFDEQSEQEKQIETEVTTGENEEETSPAPLPQSTSMTLVDRTTESLTIAWIYPAGIEGVTFDVEMEHRDTASFVPLESGLLKNSCTVSGFKPGTECRLRIVAKREGQIAASEPVLFKTEPAPPAKPDAPVSTAHTRVSLKLKWLVPESNGEEVTQYELEGTPEGISLEAIASGASQWSEKLEQLYVGKDTVVQVKKLAPGRRYSFRVRGENSVGWGPWSDVSFATTQSSVPGVPEGMRIVTKSPGLIKLGWGQPPCNGSEVSNYIVECDDGTGFRIVYNGPSSTFSLTNVKSGQWLRFRVKAENAEGVSGWSVVLEVRSSCAPPSPPAMPSVVTKKHSSVSLEWPVPPDNGSPILGYRLFMMTMSGCVIVWEGSSHRGEVNGLLPSTEYSFGCTAWNSEGDSGLSPLVNVATLASVPSQPEPPLFYKSTKSSLTLRAIKPPGNGSEVTAMSIHCDLDCSGRFVPLPKEFAGSWVRSESGAPVWECTVGGLVPATTYAFRCAAYNSVGCSANSGIAYLRTELVVPGPTSAPFVIRNTKKALTISWRPPETDGGAPITSFKVECKPAGTRGASSKEITQILNIPPGFIIKSEIDVGEFDFLTLAPGTTYQIRVQSRNSIGPGPWSDFMEVATPAAVPSTPNAPMVASVGTHDISVTWSPPQLHGADISEYKLEISSAKTNAWTPAYSGLQTSCKVDNLQPGRQYKVRVQAVSPAGVTPFSETATAATFSIPPGPPSELNAAPQSAKSMLVKWRQPEDDGGAVVTYHCLEARVCPMEGEEPADGADDDSWSELWSGPTTSAKIANRVFPGDGRCQLRVCSQNVSGKGAFCAPVTIDVPLPPAAPVSVKFSDDTKGVDGGSPALVRPPVPVVTLDSAGTNSLSLRWDASRQNGGEGVTYALEADDGTGGALKTVYKGNQTSFELVKLKSGKAYRVRLEAQNAAGKSGKSSITVFHTEQDPRKGLPPPAPAAPRLIKSDLTLLHVGWDTSSAMPGTSWRLETAASKTGESFEISYRGTENEYQHFVPSGTSARFKLFAINKHGVSNPSEIVTYTTLKKEKWISKLSWADLALYTTVFVLLILVSFLAHYFYRLKN